MRDALVAAAIDHWAPRFVANGVDMNDFFRITSAISSWDEWCAAWSAAAAEYERMGELEERRGHAVTAGEHFLRASIYYHFGKFLFVHRRDEQRAAHEATVRAFSRAMPHLRPRCERVEIPMDGWSMAGILHWPEGRERPPVVVIYPGLDSVKEELTFYARDFAARGMAVLAVDGPGQGESEWQHPIDPHYERVAAAVIDWIETRPDLDATRVGAVGVSLGGFYAARTAAFEPRLKAVVVCGGGYDIFGEWDALPELTRRAYQVRQWAASPEDARARSRLLTLDGVAERIRCPLLVIHGRQDRIVPWPQAQRIYDEAAGPKEIWMFEDGNHVCNNIPTKYRPQMADWMADRLA
ncbi:MAG: alpha/beta fold hydrolase [Clostridia bacterium]|nr:alpha/beta fold hydrolase [Clostridia bacterium]